MHADNGEVAVAGGQVVQSLSVDLDTLNEAIKQDFHSPINPIKGVCWDRFKKKWKAQACMGGKKYNIGRYDYYDDAVEAYTEFREKYPDGRKK